MLTNNGSDLVLSPMAGWSDVGMRRLCRRFGAGLCYTEMVSAKGLFYGNPNTEILLATDPEEYCGVQIFGSDPDIMGEVVREKLKKFSVIDINMGCPVAKIVKNGEGSALLKTPELARKIVEAVKKNSGGRPVTVKMRTGFYDGGKAAEFAEVLEAAGADMITVHGRTREQFFSGETDYDAIAEVKNAVDIPVCGNGGVTDGESYSRMKETGVDYVMIGRGSVGRPWIFAEVRGETPEYNLRELIKEHIRALNYLPEKTAVNIMKKHIAGYVKGMRGRKILKEKVFSARSSRELTEIIDEFIF